MDTFFKMKCNDINSEDIKFLRDLYYLMKNYNIHRIYTASIDKKKIIVAQQLLAANIGKSEFLNKIFDYLEKKFPKLYYNTIFKNHIFKYKLQLKKLFSKYEVDKIKATTFELFQGIYINDSSLCIREVDLIFKDGRIFHIESLYLDI